VLALVARQRIVRDFVLLVARLRSALLREAVHGDLRLVVGQAQFALLVQVIETRVRLQHQRVQRQVFGLQGNRLL
jgi:hypothetical protein